MEAYNVKYTDEQIKQALEACGGQPTKAAKALGADYSTLYLRIRNSEDLKAVQKAARSRLFDELQDLTISAVKTGVMPRLKCKKGVLIKDANGQAITEHVCVDYSTRLAIASNIMRSLQSDAGIVEKTEVDLTSGGKPISGVMLID